ncbi:MAG: efflux RND transporter permease subunit [Candidatus Aminicenantes bacterium]|nr:efflux RND transporter permease subunit [Candidatus Aminicenantes bacterium]
MKLPEFSVNRPITILMIIMVILVLGVISFTELGLDMLPDITYPIISVMSEYQGVAPEDMEKMVTRPLEEAISTVKGVKSVKSISQEGLSIIMVEFEWGSSLDFSAQDIRDSIGFMEDFLPDEVSKPLILKFDLTQIPILMYGITGEMDLRELRKYVIDNIKPQIERLEGVASAVVLGGLEQEILINIDKAKLTARNLSLPQVMQALRAENLNLPAGHLTRADTEYLIRTVGEYQSLDDIRNTIVSIQKDRPIYLKDVAAVEDAYAERRSYERMNKRAGLMMTISKQSGANTVIAANRVFQEMERLGERLSDNINIQMVWDQSETIKKVVSGTARNALWGGLLAVVILLLFLGNWRPTLIIGLAIPLSAIVTFIAIYFADFTLNMMTIGGLALGVGMLVDNAVVVIESIFRNMEEGKERRKASVIGASEVGMAITASTLTTIAVFLPMLYTKGMVGKLSRGMALTVSFALFASLFVALTIVPMMASRILLKAQQGKVGKFIPQFSGKRFIHFRNRYKELLQWVLQHRKIVILTALGLFVVSLFAFRFVGREFMPGHDTEFFIMQTKLPVGTPLEETDRFMRQIEDALIAQKETEVVAVNVGLSEASKQDAAFGFGATDVNEASVFAKLVERSKRDRTIVEFGEDFRKLIPNIKGAKTSIMDMSQMYSSAGGTQAPIEIKIFGKDLPVLKQIAEDIAQRIEDVEGVRDVDTTLREGKPELQIRLNRQQAADLGLTVGQVAATIQTAMLGSVATRYTTGGEEIDVRIRLREADRRSLEDLQDLLIPSPFGFYTPLRQVANLEYKIGPVKITREDQERNVSVTANIFERDLGSVTSDINEKLADITLPSGYFMEIGGQYESMMEMIRGLSLALLLAIVLVYMVMAAQFESLIHPLVVMFTIPLAIIGVVASLLITGQTLSMLSFMGIIMLAGIVVNNAIVMIDYVNQLRRRGMTRTEALLQGASIRLRPILITSITTVLAMLPMALSRSQGAEMRSPLAVVVIGGLITSTFLTLLVVPTIYTLLEDLFRRKKKSALQEEKA